MTTTYVFSGDKPERLAGIEAVWDPGTTRHMTALGVGKGWRCLEAGAGGGSVAAWLSAQVGEEGRVVATDVETTFLEPLAGGNLEVWRHDLLADDLPRGEFELVHARLLLEWLGDSDALERLAGAVAPGGWLLLEDFDWAIGGPAGDEAAGLRRTFDAMMALLDRVGYQRHYGRSLLGRIEAAGFTETATESRSYVIHGGSPGTAFERFSIESQREHIVGSGAVTDADVDAALAALADPSVHVLTPMMFAAWGRRPA